MFVYFKDFYAPTISGHKSVKLEDESDFSTVYVWY